MVEEQQELMSVAVVQLEGLRVVLRLFEFLRPLWTVSSTAGEWMQKVWGSA